MKKIKSNFGDKAEKFFNDLTDSNIDFFEEEKENLKEKKENSKQKIIENSVKQEEKIINLNGDKLKKQILETLTKQYISLYDEIENIASNKKVESGKNKGKTYLEVLDDSYFSLRNEIEKYKDDLELKKNYKNISKKLWIFSDMLADTEKGELNFLDSLLGGEKKLEKLEEIKKDTIKQLENLQKTLVNNFGTKKDKEILEKKLQKIEDKVNGNTPKDKFKKILEKNHIPDMLTNIIIASLEFLGVFDENSFISKTIEFFKHPIDTIKNWWSNDTENEERNNNKNFLIENSNTLEKENKKTKKIENIGINEKKYKNGNFEILIKDGKIKKILIDKKEYELNFNYAIDNIAIEKVDLVEKNGRNFLELKILGIDEKKKIELDPFYVRNLENKNNLKEKYILEKDLVLNFDLYLEKK